VRETGSGFAVQRQIEDGAFGLVEIGQRAGWSIVKGQYDLSVGLLCKQQQASCRDGKQPLEVTFEVEFR
jgi:hypothetical protein